MTTLTRNQSSLYRTSHKKEEVNLVPSAFLLPAPGEGKHTDPGNEIGKMSHLLGRCTSDRQWQSLLVTTHTVGNIPKSNDT